MLYFPVLAIADPEMLNDFYIAKNKFFDKHDQHRNVFYPLMGDSIVFGRSSESWSSRRKSLSVAFYKDKLKLMIELVK